MRPIKPWKRHIAPRLASGKSRENWGGRLPEPVKYALYMRAKREGKSVSWLMEEIVIQHYDLERPDYLQRKPTATEAAKAEQQAQDLAEAHARDQHRKAGAA